MGPLMLVDLPGNAPKRLVERSKQRWILRGFSSLPERSFLTRTHVYAKSKAKLVSPGSL